MEGAASKLKLSQRVWPSASGCLPADRPAAPAPPQALPPAMAGNAIFTREETLLQRRRSNKLDMITD